MKTIDNFYPKSKNELTNISNSINDFENFENQIYDCD